MTNLLTFINEVKKAMYGDSYDTTAEAKFNYAIINKTEDSLVYHELWILINAYYDYTNQRFVKIDLDATSFGIQLQAKGTYPGEHELGYDDIQGINFWRNPIRDNAHTFYDTTLYDYTDTLAHNYIGAEYANSSWGAKNGTWREFGVSSGWNNNFMTDSNGGITVGGAGFEVDGNGIFPFIRLTSSRYYDGTNAYFLTGILENAYHPSAYMSGSSWVADWDCDSNDYGAFFFGLRIPVDSTTGGKDTANAKFVVMYNNMEHASSSSINDMANQDWITLLEANDSSIKGMVSGTLTTLGAGGGGSITVDDEISSTSENPVQNKVIYTALSGKAPSSHSHVIADLPTASLSNGDTTHVPTCDTVYDAVALKENTSNKSSNMTTDTGSTSKYPTVKAVEDYIDSIIGDIEEDMLA